MIKLGYYLSAKFQYTNKRQVDFVYYDDDCRKRVSKRQGADTICTIYDHVIHQEIARGIARWNPEDKYNKAHGRKLAFTRALDNVASFGREHRRYCWEKFNKAFPVEK